MYDFLQKGLANGDYSMPGTSTTATKRRFSDSSMANDSSTPANKRTSDNQ